MKYESTRVKNINARLKQFCYLSDDNDFISITEWVNGEGFDISIERKNESNIFQLTIGEVAAITFLTKAIEGDID